MFKFKFKNFVYRLFVFEKCVYRFGNISYQMKKNQIKYILEFDLILTSILAIYKILQSKTRSTLNQKVTKQLAKRQTSVQWFCRKVLSWHRTQACEILIWKSFEKKNILIKLGRLYKICEIFTKHCKQSARHYLWVDFYSI